MNDIKADMYDENVVYAVFDNHKYGDYNPYLFKSTDKGKTWVSISNNLPERTLLWRIVQDHEKADLMFLGTEFGVYITLDGAKSWVKMKGGMPNISVRDLAIQKRENDLVAGTFGRGIYILDDYSSLRAYDSSSDAEAQLFEPRSGMWHVPRRTLGGGKKASQGDNYYVADNPPFGVEFTYYLKEEYKSKEAKRKEKESKIEKEGGALSVPEWSVLEEEKKEIKPTVWLFVYDKDGDILRKVKASNSKGFQRVDWDLRTESKQTITAENKDRNRQGYQVGPGTYGAQLFKQVEGTYSAIGEKVNFDVKQFKQGALEGSSTEAVVAHRKNIDGMRARLNDFNTDLKDTKNKVEALLKAYERATAVNEKLHQELLELRGQVLDLSQQFSGSKTRSEVGAKNEFPTIGSYLWHASNDDSTYGPTKGQQQSLKHANTLLNDSKAKLKGISDKLPGVQERLDAIGAPNVKQ